MRQGLAVRFATVSFLLLFALGCGDENSKPLPSAQEAGKSASTSQQEKKTEEPAQKDEEKKAETEQPAAPEAGDVAAVQEGTAQESPAEEPAQETESPATGMPAPYSAEAIQQAMQGATFYGVTGPINTLPQRVKEALPAEWAAELETEMEGWQAKVAEKAGMKDVSWMDLSRGMGFAASMQEDWLIAFPVTSVDAFRAALPEGATADLEGWYEVNGVFFLPHSNYVFTAQSRESLANIKGDIRTAITRMSTDSLGLVRMDGDTLVKMTMASFEQSMRDFSMMTGIPLGQQNFMVRLVNWVKELMLDIDYLTFQLDYRTGDLVIGYKVFFKEGSTLDRSVRLINPGVVEIAGYLPSNSYGLLLEYVSPESYRTFVGKYTELLGAALTFTSEEERQFADLYGRMLGTVGYQVAASLHGDAGFPLCMTGAMEAKDGLLVRELIASMYALVVGKALQAVPEDSRAMLGDGSIKTMADTMNMFLAPNGMKLVVATEKVREAVIDSLILEIDWTRVPDLGEYAWVKDVLRKSVGFAMGYSKNRVAYAFGASPTVRVKEVLEDVKGLDVSAVLGTSYDATRHFGAMAFLAAPFIDVLMGIKPVADMLAPFQGILTQLAKNRGLFISMERKDNAILVEYIIDLKNIFDIINEASASSLDPAAGAVTPPPTAIVPEPAKEAPEAQ